VASDTVMFRFGVEIIAACALVALIAAVVLIVIGR
jgi:hypothetical protein